MPRRHRLPTIWLFTDPRSPAPLAAMARLPRGAGVIFRHYELSPPERLALGRELRAAARCRGLLFLVAGDWRLAARLQADGLHQPSRDRRPRRTPRTGLRTAAAHDRPSLVAAARAGADLVFLSPVFPTRSHPSTRPIGAVRFGLLTRASPVPVAALGGMTARRYRSIQPIGIVAWGAIDAWSVRS